MATRDRLVSSGSGEEWALIDSNEEIGHHIEEECSKKQEKLSTEDTNLNETDSSVIDVVEKPSAPDSADEKLPLKRWQDGVHFYRSNLDNLSRIGLLMFVFFYIYTAFVDKSGFHFGSSDVVPDQPSFEKMNPKQMQQFLSDDNELCSKLIEELKKRKTEPFLIMGKEGKKMRDVRSLLNDLIVNSEKLVSALADLKLEGFADDEKDIIKPLLLKNLNLRTDYQRRKYLEGDFENMKLSLNHWNDEYANLRSQVVRKYHQMKTDENNQKDGKIVEINKQVRPTIDDNLVRRAQDAIKKMHSEQVVENVPKAPSGQPDQSTLKVEPKTLTERVDANKATTRDVKLNAQPPQPQTISDEVLRELSSQKEIIQMLKELKEKYYRNKKANQPKSTDSDTHSYARPDDITADLEPWEESLIEKIASAYSAFVDKNQKGSGKAKNAKIELEITDNIGKQLLKNRKKKTNLKKKNKEKYPQEKKPQASKTDSKNTKKVKSKHHPNREDLSSENRQDVNNSRDENISAIQSTDKARNVSKKRKNLSKDQKNVSKERKNVSKERKNLPTESVPTANNVQMERATPDKAAAKEKEKSRESRSSSSSYKHMNAKEKKNVFKKKFSPKKSQQIDQSVYYKGQYNKQYNKNKFCTDDDCKFNGDDDDDDDDGDDDDDDELLTAPYLKRGNHRGKQEFEGLRKHWEKPEQSKGFRQSSSNPKRQFISRTA